MALLTSLFFRPRRRIAISTASDAAAPTAAHTMILVVLLMDKNRQRRARRECRRRSLCASVQLVSQPRKHGIPYSTVPVRYTSARKNPPSEGFAPLICGNNPEKRHRGEPGHTRVQCTVLTIHVLTIQPNRAKQTSKHVRLSVSYTGGPNTEEDLKAACGAVMKHSRTPSRQLRSSRPRSQSPRPGPAEMLCSTPSRSPDRAPRALSRAVASGWRSACA